MEETFDQKVVRNVQGNFAIYKTNEVVGDKSMLSNLEWSETEDVDKKSKRPRFKSKKVSKVNNDQAVTDKKIKKRKK